MKFVPLPGICECGDRIRAGTLGIRALTERCLEAIETGNEALRAIVFHNPDKALDDADRLQERLDHGEDLGPLHGIPIVVKDTIHVAGMPTAYGSRALAEPAAYRDATAIARLRAAGAVILGKAATWELGCGTGEFQSASAAPDALNPVNPAYFAGGSSNGSAVAVAAGFACAAIGGDTGGSVRSPAAACGIIGLKPTFGLIDRAGAFAHSPSLDHIGCFATDPAGVQLVFEAMAGLPRSGTEPADNRFRPRLGLLDECFSSERGSPRLAAAFRTFLSRIGAAGFDVSTVSLGSDPAVWRSAMEIVGGYESHRQNHALLRLPEDELSPSIRRWLTQAGQILPEQYRQALAKRERLCAHLQRLFEVADLLVSPTAVHSVPLDTDEAARQRYSTDSSLSIFNLSGHPAVSVPIGRDDAGMPMGLQLTASRGDERLLSRVGAALMDLARSR